MTASKNLILSIWPISFDSMHRPTARSSKTASRPLTCALSRPLRTAVPRLSAGSSITAPPATSSATAITPVKIATAPSVGMTGPPPGWLANGTFCYPCPTSW